MSVRETEWRTLQGGVKIDLRLYPILRVVLIYIAFASLWILSSDQVAQHIFPGPGSYHIAQSYKGIFFVLTSGLLLFLLLKRELRQREAVWEAHLHERNLLLEQLERKANELTSAYDATIEGWARALELRDREVLHHSDRVTEVTLGLARRMELNDDALVHLRRGALLHDIGKMGVPDSLLLKPGPLDASERKDMQKHTEYALSLLDEIEFLRPALEVPASHHERWDGRGYPNGLKGEEIPLLARIFTVVDVWDALTSNRPYRKAWSPEMALRYIKSQAGQHFDPAVVDMFVRMMTE